MPRSTKGNDFGLPQILADNATPASNRVEQLSYPLPLNRGPRFGASSFQDLWTFDF